MGIPFLLNRVATPELPLGLRFPQPPNTQVFAYIMSLRIRQGALEDNTFYDKLDDLVNNTKIARWDWPRIVHRLLGVLYSALSSNSPTGGLILNTGIIPQPLICSMTAPACLMC